MYDMMDLISERKEVFGSLSCRQLQGRLDSASQTCAQKASGGRNVSSGQIAPVLWPATFKGPKIRLASETSRAALAPQLKGERWGRE